MLHIHSTCFVSWWFKERDILTYTLYLTEINFVSLCTSPEKIRVTWLGISGDLQPVTLVSKDTTFRRLDRLLSNDQSIFPLMGDHNCDSVFNINTPPPPPNPLPSILLGWGLTFSSYPWRLAKIMFTPEDFHKMRAYPWRIWVLPMKNFVKIKASPPENSIYFFTLPLKKSSVFITYPWRIPWFLIRGVRILNAIAH